MSQFVFNSQVTVNGVLRKRGDAVLVGWRSTVRTGHINQIIEQINAPGNYYFTVNVMTGDGNNPLPGKPPVEAVDSGFYHLDDPHPTGNRLVFPDEGDAAAERLNNLMQGRADVVTEASKVPGQATTAPPRVPGTRPDAPPVQADEAPSPLEVPGMSKADRKALKRKQ